MKIEHTRKKIVEVILLNFQSNLGHIDKLEVINIIVIICDILNVQK